MQHLHPRVASFFHQFFWRDDAVVVKEQIDGVTQNFKSQQACITALALGYTLNAEKMLIHPVELEFDENQKSLPQYTDGRSSRTIQCCWTRIANQGYHRWHEKTAQYSSMGGDSFRSCGIRLVRRLRKSLLLIWYPRRPSKSTTNVWRSICQPWNNSSGITVTIVTRKSMVQKEIILAGSKRPRCRQIA